LRSDFDPLIVRKSLRAAELAAATPGIGPTDPEALRREAQLKLEASDWGRIVVAAAVTAFALPFLLRSGPSGDQPAVATVQGGDVAAGLRSGSAESTVPSTAPDIAFLNGPATTLEAAPILIGVPAPKSATEIEGKVGFQVVPPLWRELPRPCIAGKTGVGAVLPIGGLITLVNLSNNHTTTCVVAVHRDIPPDQVLQLTESIFNELGDQIDAPLTVRISWK
jgi:hypothetical protein